ncbi:unnamed protein product [Closterium sp. Naga37s-1]|nr:unnamed protein product [Closterium sp. Naga37s-1]
MSHSKQPRSQGKRKDGKNRPRGGARGGAESSMGDPFALSEERLASLDLEGGLNQRVDGALHRSAARQLIQACQAALPRQRKQAACSLQSNRVLCIECSMVAWTPNSAPTPPPHTTYPPPRSDAPSLSTATLSSTQFSRNKTKGRGGGTGTGASWVASVPLVVLLPQLAGRVKQAVRPWRGVMQQTDVSCQAGVAAAAMAAAVSAVVEAVQQRGSLAESVV